MTRCAKRRPTYTSADCHLEFSIDAIEGQEATLLALYPGNSNVRPKIRQQLQVLRDMGWLAFNGRGTYRRT